MKITFESKNEITRIAELLRDNIFPSPLVLSVGDLEQACAGEDRGLPWQEDGYHMEISPLNVRTAARKGAWREYLLDMTALGSISVEAAAQKLDMPETELVMDLQRRALGRYLMEQLSQEDFRQSWGAQGYEDWPARYLICEEAELVFRMLTMTDYTPEQVATVTGLPLNKVKQIQEAIQCC